MLLAGLGAPALHAAHSTPLAPADDGLKAALSDCVSVAPSVPDYWCTNTCTASYCPSDLCRCGKDRASAEESQLQARVKELGWRSDRNWGHGSTVACKSIDASVNDYWCTTECADDDNLTAMTSASAKRCPANLCRCATFTEEELKARAEEAKLVCDFDAAACVQDQGGSAAGCPTCDRHITLCTSRPARDGEAEMTLDACLDEVAGRARECRTCNSTESSLAYKVRLGIEAQAGVTRSVRQRAAGSPGT